MPTVILFRSSVAELGMSRSSRKNAAITRGMLAIKENVKAVSFLVCVMRRVVMVMPERDIPGAIAKACVKPINVALGKLTSFFPFLIFFVRTKIRPFTIRKIAVVRPHTNKDSKFSLKIRAIDPVITVVAMM
ncbi:MAG: hypothetical protein ABIC68_00120 [Candidatus Omnitrophota bacterium]